MGGGVDRLGGWSAERARGGKWVAAKLVREDDGAAVHKVRRRRPLAVPAAWRRNEVEAHIARLVASGELD